MKDKRKIEMPYYAPKWTYSNFVTLKRLSEMAN